MFNVMVLVLLALVVFGFFYVYKNKYRSSTKKDKEESAPSETKQFNYEDGILDIQRKISLSLKKSHRQGVESLVDKCVEVNYAIRSVDPQETSQLHSVPGDFKRLVEKHLPEFIANFSEVSNSNGDENLEKFENIILQLNGELDTILENIKTRNYVDFANKHGFMKIRYSDKF